MSWFSKYSSIIASAIAAIISLLTSLNMVGWSAALQAVHDAVVGGAPIGIVTALISFALFAIKALTEHKANVAHDEVLRAQLGSQEAVTRMRMSMKSGS